jgi:hypothetical protein
MLLMTWHNKQGMDLKEPAQKHKHVGSEVNIHNNRKLFLHIVFFIIHHHTASTHLYFSHPKHNIRF